MRILVVDSYPLFRVLVRSFVRATFPDFVVEECDSLADALSRARTMRERGSPFDAVVTSLELGDGSGVDLLRDLGRTGDVARRIVMGGRVDVRAALDREPSVTATLPRPFSPAELARALGGGRADSLARGP